MKEHDYLFKAINVLRATKYFENKQKYFFPNKQQ